MPFAPILCHFNTPKPPLARSSLRCDKAHTDLCVHLQQLVLASPLSKMEPVRGLWPMGWVPGMAR